jgi:hypothetical protein
MDDHEREIDRWNSAAISVWENEGGALGRYAVDRHYGRRVEMDRSWTVYHVFSGVPASKGGNPMTGLSRLDATEGMLSLNLRNERRQREKNRQADDTKDHESEAGRS